MTIEIGKEFYRYVAMGGVFTYRVVGIRSYETESLYELECQSCTHGYKCLLLCALDDDNKLQYIRTLNDDEDNPQDYWHKDCGEFFQTKNEVLASAYKKQLQKYQDDISTQKNKLKEMESSYKHIEVLLNELGSTLTDKQ